MRPCHTTRRRSGAGFAASGRVTFISTSPRTGWKGSGSEGRPFSMTAAALARSRSASATPRTPHREVSHVVADSSRAALVEHNGSSTRTAAATRRLVGRRHPLLLAPHRAVEVRVAGAGPSGPASLSEPAASRTREVPAAWWWSGEPGVVAACSSTSCPRMTFRPSAEWPASADGAVKSSSALSSSNAAREAAVPAVRGCTDRTGGRSICDPDTGTREQLWPRCSESSSGATVGPASPAAARCEPPAGRVARDRSVPVLQRPTDGPLGPGRGTVTCLPGPADSRTPHRCSGPDRRRLLSRRASIPNRSGS